MSSISQLIEKARSEVRYASLTNGTRSPNHIDIDLSQKPKSAHNSNEAALNFSCRPGAFPCSSLNNLSMNDQDVGPHSIGPDLVTRGLITQHILEKHFSYYKYCLNPQIYHLISSSDTVANLLERSSLLLLAICAAAAFSAGTEDYETCLKIFIDEVSAMAFYHNPSFDDVRALCIGAFWLGKEATALNAMGQRSS